jgi:hypothetical protein
MPNQSQIGIILTISFHVHNPVLRNRNSPQRSTHSQKQKRQQGCWRYGMRTRYYPLLTVRGALPFVKEKAEESSEGTAKTKYVGRAQHAAPLQGSNRLRLSVATSARARFRKRALQELRRCSRLSAIQENGVPRNGSRGRRSMLRLHRGIVVRGLGEPSSGVNAGKKGEAGIATFSRCVTEV